MSQEMFVTEIRSVVKTLNHNDKGKMCLSLF